MYPTLRDMQKLQESDVPLDNPRSILYDNSIETKGRSLAADEEKRLTFGMMNSPDPTGPGLLMTPFGGCESRNSQTFFNSAVCRQLTGFFLYAVKQPDALIAFA